MLRMLLLSVAALIACTGFTQNPKLATGWYYVSEKTDSSIYLAGPKDTVYIYPTPIVSVNEFKKLNVVNNNMGSALDITLKESGKEKFAIATKNWIGKKLAFVVDGILQMSPVVQSEITEGKASITGLFTNSELKALKKKLEKEMSSK
jgi:preprotein translocase subunit SecD